VRRYEYPDHETMVYNLLDCYEKAGYDGQSWYRESRAFCKRESKTHGVTLATMAGITAALSPQVQWHRNKIMASDVAAHGWTTGQTHTNLEKARRIWLGERPLQVLGGPKVRAFYRAIMGNEDAVVLDTWMATALQWPHNGFTARQYEKCEAALREAAAHTALSPANFQAVVWTHVRGGGD
jgi:hypothetical protein